MNQPSGHTPEGGFNKFTWMLLAGFGSVLMLISVAALSKLWAVSDRVADQAGDIKVILATQNFQALNTSAFTTAFTADLQKLRDEVADIREQQLEGARSRE
jgi:hypothetical protein